MHSLRNRPLGAGLFIGGLVCLALTATMNFLQGESLGVTESGKWVNSISSVVVDVIGLLLMGFAAGACLAARRWIPAGIFSLIVVLSAGWSINSMISFQASERMGVSDQYKRTLAQHDKADKLAADNAGWYVRMTKAVGRVARKDFMTGASSEVKAIREAKVDARVDPAAGTKALAKITKQDIETVAIGQISYLALLLILIKAVCFPSSGFFWGPLAAKNSASDTGNSGSGGGGKSKDQDQKQPDTRKVMQAGNSNVTPLPKRTADAENSPSISVIQPTQRSAIPVGSRPKMSEAELLDYLQRISATGLPVSQRAIAQRCGWSQPTIHRRLKHLRERKPTFRTARPYVHGGQVSLSG